MEKKLNSCFGNKVKIKIEIRLTERTYQHLMNLLHAELFYFHKK